MLIVINVRFVYYLLSAINAKAVDKIHVLFITWFCGPKMNSAWSVEFLWVESEMFVPNVSY